MRIFHLLVIVSQPKQGSWDGSAASMTHRSLSCSSSFLWLQSGGQLSKIWDFVCSLLCTTIHCLSLPSAPTSFVTKSFCLYQVGRMSFRLGSQKWCIWRNARADLSKQWTTSGSASTFLLTKSRNLSKILMHTDGSHSPCRKYRKHVISLNWREF